MMARFTPQHVFHHARSSEGSPSLGSRVGADAGAAQGEVNAPVFGAVLNPATAPNQHAVAVARSSAIVRTQQSGLVLGEDGLLRPAWAAQDPLLRAYYDTEWGMPVRDEQGIFERLSLEAFQSGLSWATILRKREGFRAAFDAFDPEKVAQYDETDIARLLGNAQIVRNGAKIRATIGNAQATLQLRSRGGLAELVWSHQPQVTPFPVSPDEVPTTSPESVALARELKQAGFAFVGPTTMYALMEAVGMVDTHLMGSHRRGSSGVWPSP